tara:strand:- start:7072 stop:8937 length:1866 start_codon:yes stop_codon:yes gene_type:complete
MASEAAPNVDVAAPAEQHTDPLAVPNPPLASAAVPGARGFAEESQRNALIMMVDDEPTTIEVLRMFLEDAGYRNFVTTSDSREAISLIGSRHPDVVLLDLMMPHVGGFDILSAMRADALMRHTPVIMLTSSVDGGTKLTALELGATDFLGKPVDPSELALRLRNTLTAKAHQDSLALHDSLTGLPNRQLFGERLERALFRAQAAAQHCAVVHIDLDRFKKINDSLGQATGDMLLKAIAHRIGAVLDWSENANASGEREAPFVARLGGDEFAIVVPDLDNPDFAVEIADRVNKSFAQPFIHAHGECYVAASLGAAVSPQDGADADTLLQHASAATVFAKQRGLRQFHFYSGEVSDHVSERFMLEHELHSALQRNQLKLFYQPKLCLKSDRVVGAEALMRWDLPGTGLVSPGKFIPIAEDTGLIVPIGEWALRESIRQLRCWHDANHDITISVNVSAIQFRDDAFIEQLEAILLSTGVRREMITIELTETLLMENARESELMLNRIREMGARVSVDDFGTGYSSLSYLKRFSVDELKIDRSFLNGIPHDKDNSAIVSAVIGMAHGLGLHVVAEGVEEEAQLQFLQHKHCHEFQGFLVSPPIPAENFSELLERSRESGWRAALV